MSMGVKKGERKGEKVLEVPYLISDPVTSSEYQPSIKCYGEF